MAGFQFLRVETFAQVRGQLGPTRAAGGRGGKGGQQKLTARQAIEEATRAENCTPHVPSPIKPNTLFGIESSELLAWCDSLYEQAAAQKVETKTGFKKQRTDTPILLGAVASFPSAADENNVEYTNWRSLTVKFLKEKYGDNLISVVEHTDETFGHIHGLISNAGKSVKMLHDGHLAAMEASGREAQGTAYKRGCAALQDQFYEAVGLPCGLARTGPRQARKTRSEWLADQRASEHLASEKKRIEALKAEAVEQLKAATSTRADAKKVHAATLEKHAEITRRMAALSATEKEAVAAKEKQLAEHQQKKKVEDAAAAAQRVSALLMKQGVKSSTPKKTR